MAEPQLERALEGLTDTGFEVLVLRALRLDGLPRPTTQFELFDMRAGS